ncbi:MAG: lipoyl synthase [Planctomycetota bacterium]|nr:lipoyl synthase [Planctomycetota bacterium]MDI6786932.1 lipoyl synthase [Planctomycetota bacterium]
MFFPEWLKTRKHPLGKSIAINRILKDCGLHTVCQSARCPNIFECFSRGIATFLILGNICTRHCRFCAIPTHALSQNERERVGDNEPSRVAIATKKMALKHVVITSVTRDDLQDGGADVFYETILKVREMCPDTIIEVLTPDFSAEPRKHSGSGTTVNKTSIRKVIKAMPDVFNHNIETVSRLYPEIRPEANYQRSLNVLLYVTKLNSNIITKSGLMLGLGEEQNEVEKTMSDLRRVKCRSITLGQYLRPSLNPETVEVKRFITPEEFAFYRQRAYQMGFETVSSGPFVRSSYRQQE